jgi:RpiR family carbohydrate utilization transcriptional regulator
VLTRIKAIQPTLTKSEQKVAEFVLQQPRMAVEMPIASLAEAVGVSTPTVIRFCRSFGCKGFQDFKVLLAQDLGGNARYAHREVESNESAAELTAKVIDGAIASLLKVRNGLNPTSLQRAIEWLGEAERIEFYGIGGSGIVAQDAQHKFFRLGTPVVAYADPTIYQTAAGLLDHRAVVVAISQSGHNASLIAAAKSALETGAKVIAITSSGSPLARLASVALHVDLLRDEDSYAPIKSRMGHLAVVDVLAVGVALRLKLALGASRASQSAAS